MDIRKNVIILTNTYYKSFIILIFLILLNCFLLIRCLKVLAVEYRRCKFLVKE